MESHLLPYKDSCIHYLKFGNGTRFLLCFHGYGEDAFSYLFLEKILGRDYTLIALDLPFHGRTDWKEGLDFTPADLENIIHSIVPLDLQTISLIGYSLGGRIALTLLQNLPSKIERVVVIAPDGLHRNFWYWLSTQTRIGNKLFNYTMKKPHWFFAGMKIMRKLNILNKSIFKFAHSYLDDEEERSVLYRRWTTMRQFIVHGTDLSKMIGKNQIEVRMLFGSYDRIILKESVDPSITKNDRVKIKTIKAGHQLLKEKHARDIASLFYE